MPTEYRLWPGDTGYVQQVVTDNSGNIVSEQLISVGAADNPPAAAANFANLVAKAQTALANNQAFLALGAPTNAQAVAQVQALTRQTNAVIYYLLHQITGLNSVPGT